MNWCIGSTKRIRRNVKILPKFVIFLLKILFLRAPKFGAGHVQGCFWGRESNSITIGQQSGGSFQFEWKTIETPAIRGPRRKKKIFKFQFFQSIINKNLMVIIYNNKKK